MTDVAALFLYCNGLGKTLLALGLKTIDILLGAIDDVVGDFDAFVVVFVDGFARLEF